MASLEPDELKDMIASIRTIEATLGDGEKTIRASERGNAPVVRKSLVALKPIAKGDLFSEENLGAKRPGTGTSPMNYWSLLGTPSPRDIDTDEII